MSNDRHANGRKCEPPRPGFDPIEAALRQMFSEVESEEVPDDFAALIAKFAEQQRRPGAD